MRSRAGVGLGVVIALACSGDARVATEGAPDGLRPLPMGRAAFPRSGHLTYEISAVERAGDETRVDLVFRNGTSRDYTAVLVRVIALGTGGERETRDSPLGAMGRGTTKRHRVYFEALGFRVSDVLVEVVYTHP